MFDATFPDSTHFTAKQNGGLGMSLEQIGKQISEKLPHVHDLLCVLTFYHLSHTSRTFHQDLSLV